MKLKHSTCLYDTWTCSPSHHRQEAYCSRVVYPPMCDHRLCPPSSPDVSWSGYVRDVQLRADLQWVSSQSHFSEWFEGPWASWQQVAVPCGGSADVLDVCELCMRVGWGRAARGTGANTFQPEDPLLVLRGPSMSSSSVAQVLSSWYLFLWRTRSPYLKLALLASFFSLTFSLPSIFFPGWCLFICFGYFTSVAIV